MMYLAAALAMLAVLMAVPSGTPANRLDAADPRGRTARAWPAWAGMVLASAAVPVAGGLMGGPSGAVLGFSAGVVTFTVGVFVRKARRRSGRARLRTEVVRGCQVLAAQLRVGLVPAAALTAAARDCPVLAEAAAEHAVGVPAPVALRRVRARHGLVLEELATAWTVAERAGASLTDTIDALAERLTARREVERLAEAELAAPRATGRLLALLPFAGLGLGYLFGGDPVGFLTGSTVGQLCLVLGTVLACAGALWTERLAEWGAD